LREQADVRPRAEEGREGGSWVLLDYGDIVVHVFLEETREYYSLERLWADAPRVDWESTVTA
jgi:ribosome-associated protein